MCFLHFSHAEENLKTHVNTENNNFAIKLVNANLPFKGQLNMDLVGKTNGASVMYFGGVEGLFAGIITQNILESKKQSREEKARADEANQVLQNYSATIDQFDLFNTTSKAVAQLDQSSDYSVRIDNNADADHTLLSILPVAVMSHSADVLQLHSEIVYGMSEPYKKTNIIVHSAPVSDIEAWNKNGYLQDTISELIKSTLSIAMNEYNEQLSRHEKMSTIRYLDNGKKKVERGYIIETECSEIIFESNRNIIKSVIPYNHCLPANESANISN